MSHLRFTPQEYRTIALLCVQLKLGRTHQAAFKRALVAGLDGAEPALAERVARLRGRRLTVLYHHFRTPVPFAAGPAPHGLTADEVEAVAAVATGPFHVRFARPLRGVLVEFFSELWPDPAGKLRQMSGSQFEVLYHQARKPRRSA